MESFEDMDGATIMVHERAFCSAEPGTGCPIHAPSNHPYVHLPLRWRQEQGAFFRVEPNGRQHLDPDTAAWMARQPRNQALCLQCNTVVESEHRHDYVTCPCGYLSVDGGPDYRRRAINDDHDAGPDQWVELSTGFPDDDD